MGKTYCNNCNKYKKFNTPKMSYIFNGTLIKRRIYRDIKDFWFN